MHVPAAPAEVVTATAMAVAAATIAAANAAVTGMAAVPRSGGGPRSGYRSNVPERTYTPRDAESAAPVAPKRTERVDDFADLSFGKIEL